MTTILLLHSNDGQQYVHPVAIPEGMDIGKAAEIARKAIDEAQDANAEEYDWENDILPALKRSGFLEVDWIHGPTWDERN